MGLRIDAVCSQVAAIGLQFPTVGLHVATVCALSVAAVNLQVITVGL